VATRGSLDWRGRRRAPAISYSSKDDAFAKRLYADLQNTGVRCWLAPHDLPIGAKTWDAIDAAIRVRDKVLLILSKNAIASDWVEDEQGFRRGAPP
jgi:TIR domain